jgi:hypothetical protein
LSSNATKITKKNIAKMSYDALSSAAKTIKKQPHKGSETISNASSKMIVTKVIRRSTKIIHERHHATLNPQRGDTILLEKIRYKKGY